MPAWPRMDNLASDALVFGLRSTADARVLVCAMPEDKLEIVKSLRCQGLVSAMLVAVWITHLRSTLPALPWPRASRSRMSPRGPWLVSVEDDPASIVGVAGKGRGICWHPSLRPSLGPSSCLCTLPGASRSRKGRVIYAGIQVVAKFVAVIMPVHIAGGLQIFPCIVIEVPVMSFPLGAPWPLGSRILRFSRAWPAAAVAPHRCLLGAGLPGPRTRREAPFCRWVAFELRGRFMHVRRVTRESTGEVGSELDLASSTPAHSRELNGAKQGTATGQVGDVGTLAGEAGQQPRIVTKVVDDHGNEVDATSSAFEGSEEDDAEVAFIDSANLTFDAARADESFDGAKWLPPPSRWFSPAPEWARPAGSRCSTAKRGGGPCRCQGGRHRHHASERQFRLFDCGSKMDPAGSPLEAANEQADAGVKAGVANSVLEAAGGSRPKVDLAGSPLVLANEEVVDAEFKVDVANSTFEDAGVTSTEVGSRLHSACAGLEAACERLFVFGANVVAATEQVDFAGTPHEESSHALPLATKQVDAAGANAQVAGAALEDVSEKAEQAGSGANLAGTAQQTVHESVPAVVVQELTSTEQVDTAGLVVASSATHVPGEGVAEVTAKSDLDSSVLETAREHAAVDGVKSYPIIKHVDDVGNDECEAYRVFQVAAEEDPGGTEAQVACPTPEASREGPGRVLFPLQGKLRPSCWPALSNFMPAMRSVPPSSAQGRVSYLRAVARLVRFVPLDRVVPCSGFRAWLVRFPFSDSGGGYRRVVSPICSL